MYAIVYLLAVWLKFSLKLQVVLISIIYHISKNRIRKKQTFNNKYISYSQRQIHQVLINVRRFKKL